MGAFSSNSFSKSAFSETAFSFSDVVVLVTEWIIKARRRGRR